jgi:hypothetical protein
MSDSDDDGTYVQEFLKGTVRSSRATIVNVAIEQARPKRRMTKDQAIYGVFADSDDDDAPREKRGKRYRRKLHLYLSYCVGGAVL